jgi:peptidyl-prolyl cis-trans isomerase A (cyclophilin A)
MTLLLLSLLACKDQATTEENDRLKIRVGDLERASARLESENEVLKTTLARLQGEAEEGERSGRGEALGLAPGQGLYATFRTSEGDVECKLRPEQAPETVANFVQLARGEREWTDPRTGAVSRAPLYDGTIFHRVIPGFMIQGGDPLGTGTGGPGYKFADEVGDFTVFEHTGILAMANAGPNTNGSQFFITEGTPTHLNGKHSIFGDCKNLDIVSKIANVPTGRNDKPATDVVLKHIDIVAR